MKVSEDCTVRTKDSNKTNKSNVTNLIKPSLIALAVAQSLSMSSLQAATIYVGGSNGAGCELSQAILSANNDASEPGSQCVAGSGDDVIELNQNVTLTEAWKWPGQNYASYFGLPRISSNITINGNGHTINRDISASDFGIITASDYELILNDISVMNGAKSLRADYGPFGMGSAVTAHQTDLILNNSIISNNAGEEGAIFVRGGSLKLNNTTISNNSVGLYTDGSEIDITGSTISNNVTGVRSYLPQSLEITNSFIYSNNGHGIDVRTLERFGLPINGLVPSVKIQNSSVTYNGRGINLGSIESVEIHNSDISNNSGSSCAGLRVRPSIGYGPYVGSEVTHSVIIDKSTFSNNVSETDGGAACFFSDKAPHYSGRYIVGTSYPSVTILNSTFTENLAGNHGGAIIFQGPTSYNRSYSQAQFVVDIPNTIVNSTFSSNSAGQLGGAIFLAGSSYSSSFLGNTGSRELNLINSSVVSNVASLHGGGLYTAQNKGKISLNLSNSIIAGNRAYVSGSEVHHLSALSYPNEDLVDSNNNVLGSSLESNFQAFNGFVPSDTDITATIDGNSPAMLDDIVSPLQDNGGSTQTHALTLGSPAIDAGDLDACINDPVSGLDQRGAARGEFSLCDIGAYEAGAIGELPAISIESVRSSVYEGGASNNRVIVFSFKLSSPQSENISFDYQTIDQTALGNVDYETRSGTVTFPAGQVNQVRAIKLIGDTEVEPNETFKVMLSNPTNNAILNVDQSEATGTILNDDFGGNLPSISVESAKPAVYEGNIGDSRVIAYTFKLSSPQTEKVSFDYQTVDETAVGSVDYEIRSGRVTFTPGQVSQVRAIKLIGDANVEADETFKVVLSNPSGNAELDLNQSEALGTILNDEFGGSVPSISIESSKPSVYEGDAGDNRVIVFTFILSSALTEEASFDYQTQDVDALGGVDYQMRSGIVTFAPGQVNQVRGIQLIGDSEVEANETFKVVLSNASGNATLDLNKSEALGTILNNDW